MAEKIEVRPTPIQRNRLDVATELTQLHADIRSSGGDTGIAELFARYYALVFFLEQGTYGGGEKLKEFLPQEIRDKLQ